MNTIIIDAANTVLGRLASYIAKQALLGKSIVVVNCNLAVLSGNKFMVINQYKEERAKGSTSLAGPHFPKNPERLVKRTIRGMLPYKQERGRSAFKRVMCYNDIPAEYAASQKINLAKTLKFKVLTLKELSQRI